MNITYFTILLFRQLFPDSKTHKEYAAKYDLKCKISQYSLNIHTIIWVDRMIMHLMKIFHESLPFLKEKLPDLSPQIFFSLVK